MIRLFLRLIGIRDFDTCMSCETLKQQLAIANEENKRLTDTLLEIFKPKIIEAQPIVVNQVDQTAGLFSRRRAVAEERDRAAARILRDSSNVAKADLRDVKFPVETSSSIEQLENELGIEGEMKQNG